MSDLSPGSLPQAPSPTRAAWLQALDDDHRFVLKQLAALPYGQTLGVNPGNPGRWRDMLNRMAEMGLCTKERIDRSWRYRPTFYGKRVFKIIGYDVPGMDKT